jgi:hypothetical protein
MDSDCTYLPWRILHPTLLTQTHVCHTQSHQATSDLQHWTLAVLTATCSLVTCSQYNSPDSALPLISLNPKTHLQANGLLASNYSHGNGGLHTGARGQSKAMKDTTLLHVAAELLK